MTLRARLLVLTLSMVAIVSVTLVALSLNSLVDTSLDVAIGSSEMAGRQIQSFIQRRLTENAAPAPTLAETKQIWRDTVAGDRDLAALLEQTMAQSRSIVEISVADEEGTIAASSNPERRGLPMTAREDLRSLKEASPLGRITAILTARTDYESHVPLGIPGQRTPVFTIQILVSPILLRAATLPELGNVAIASGFALAIAFCLAYWSANLALRPLARISHLIDDIVSGEATAPARLRNDDARELAIIESKLSLLGERFRGARQDASQLRVNLEDVLSRLDAGTRKRFEDQIALAQRLTAINSLTGRVAHEIKNPLNSIALRLEMLRARIVDEIPDAVPEFSVLSEEVTRLDRVVRTFLDFNRPVAVALENASAADAAAEIFRFLEPEAELRGIRVTLDVPDKPVVVKADTGLLRQALVNVAMNAIEAMNQGGELGLHVSQTDGRCVIRITDTGPGIPKDQREKIFQLYYTTKPQGTGIGLAMTFRAIQLHGGTIEVDSETGKGTIFTVTLPLSDGYATA